MAVKCSKCGEELLGAVNRCWRCGQPVVMAIAQGAPPGAESSKAGANEKPIEASVASDPLAEARFLSDRPGQRPIPRTVTTAELIDARRAQMMAMGGTVTSLALGIFAAVLAVFWPPAALVAVLGLAMGIWGLSSSRRNLALVGMLICCLAIGIGAFGIARNISIALQKNRAIPFEDSPPVDAN